MTTEEAQAAALNSLMLGLGSREDVKVCRRGSGDPLRTAEFETRGGERFLVRVAVEGVERPRRAGR